MRISPGGQWRRPHSRSGEEREDAGGVGVRGFGRSTVDGHHGRCRACFSGHGRTSPLGGSGPHGKPQGCSSGRGAWRRRRCASLCRAALGVTCQSAAFSAGQAAHEPQVRGAAVRALQRSPRGLRRAFVRLLGARREQELESAKSAAIGRVQEAERADPVKALRGGVLEETAQEFVGRQRHRPALVTAAVAVAKGDRAVVAGDNRLVGDRGAVHVAAEVLDHLVGALDRRLGEDDPRLAPGDDRERDGGEGFAGEIEEATAKELRERFHGDEVAPATAREAHPGAAIGAEAAAGDEHVDVGMPLEGSRPRVQDGERADLGAEVVVVGAEGGKRVERCAEQDGEELLLMGAHDPPELRREREHDVEVLDRKEQVALPGDPSRSRRMSALRTGAVLARVVEDVLATAIVALGEVSPESRRAAVDDGLEGAPVARQHGPAMTGDVVGRVPAQNVGEAEHRLGHGPLLGMRGGTNAAAHREACQGSPGAVPFPATIARRARGSTVRRRRFWRRQLPRGARFRSTSRWSRPRLRRGGSPAGRSAGGVAARA